ncbi:MAG: hypothetical protein XU12_C0006G0052 [Deltaproteobacteria bacterium CSP1-8]|nr:MAG: hypothetical protein XU12_C0006G0052 [Deltaproteobacteria bacterium CSP1-8]
MKLAMVISQTRMKDLSTLVPEAPRRDVLGGNSF